MTNDELLRELIGEGYLKTPRIIEAFRAIDRADFVPEELQERVYENYPLPIGYGQTISQPLTVAFMLELLDPQPGEKIFDVGAGSGWQTALLAHIAGPTGRIAAVERIRELAAVAEENIAKYDFIKSGIVTVHWGDASRGVPPELLPARGFDKIIAAASAKTAPEAWKRQLKTGGRMVIPIGNGIVAVEKSRGGELTAKEYAGFSFVPLIIE